MSLISPQLLSFLSQVHVPGLLMKAPSDASRPNSYGISSTSLLATSVNAPLELSLSEEARTAGGSGWSSRSNTCYLRLPICKAVSLRFPEYVGSENARRTSMGNGSLKLLPCLLPYICFAKEEDAVIGTCTMVLTAYPALLLQSHSLTHPRCRLPPRGRSHDPSLLPRR